jgi:hypothetical protein
MRPVIVCLTALFAACASSAIDPSSSPDPDASPGIQTNCYSVLTQGTPAPDVRLPTLIQLSPEAAPGFVEPGRLAVREPGGKPPMAPISWWIPRGTNRMELVLGGGYTGYTFELHAAEHGAWVGTGSYFADFGVDPTPVPLSIQLTPRSCL